MKQKISRTSDSGGLYRDWNNQKFAPCEHDFHDEKQISVIMATYNTPPRFLRQAVKSVLHQTCNGWMLLISDDASTSRRTKRALKQISKKSPEVIIFQNNENQGISKTLNVALQSTSTPFFGILDHDDLLHPRAIELMIDAISSSKNIVLAYSDEDKVDSFGRHSNPFYKPDYSPELLLSQMYLNHFTIMRTLRVSELGGFRAEFDGAQDHDLAMRLNLKEHEVHHVPFVLYHWRVWSQSTAQSIDTKPWAQVAGVRAQTAALESTSFGGFSKPSKIKGLNEIHFVPRRDQKISIIIPTASKADATSKFGKLHVDNCLESLRNLDLACNFEIIVVHTGALSSEQSRRYREQNYTTILFDQEVFNFSRAVNIGAENANGEHLLLLNDDTRAKSTYSISSMLEYSQQPEIGAVGARLTYPNGRLQHGGIIMVNGLPTHPWHNSPENNLGYYGSLATPRNFMAVTAAALMVKRKVFEDVRGFSEEFAHDYNDVDFCIRVRESGLRNVWTPFAHFDHIEGASLIRDKANEAETDLFLDKWSGLPDFDPYYSPNLSQELGTLYESR
jgi:GT2 family glycosyltransferase